MYTATVQVNITAFNPIGSGNITASLSAPNDTSPNAPTGVFGGTGEKLVVVTPQNYTGAVQVTFQLPGTDYVLLGIAIDPEQPPGSSESQEFRTIAINRDSTGSQLTVTDACVPTLYGTNFSYLILVQELSSYRIGTIDPDEENEPQ